MAVPFPRRPDRHSRLPSIVPTSFRPASDETLLGHYRKIETATRAMLGAARRHDWIGVSDCADEIEQLTLCLESGKAVHGRLSPQADLERLRMLQRMVLADAEVRRLSIPGSRRLDALFAAPSRSPRGTVPPAP